MLAFASRDRLMSIHDGNLVADARAGTLLRSCAPWRTVPGTRNYHSFDVVISGGNPLLAVILLRRAVDRGLSAAVTLPGGPDDWPYDLSMTLAGGSLVLSASGLDPLSVDAGLPGAQAVVRRMLFDLAGKAFLLGAEGFILSDKHPSAEVALYPCDERGGGAISPDQSALASEFRSSSRGLVVAACLPDRKTAVFAKTLVLTSMPRSFTNTSLTVSGGIVTISWEHPLVVGVGTARNDIPDGATAARIMVDDVLCCSRALPLTGVMSQ